MARALVRIQAKYAGALFEANYAPSVLLSTVQTEIQRHFNLATIKIVGFTSAASLKLAFDVATLADCSPSPHGRTFLVIGNRAAAIENVKHAQAERDRKEEEQKRLIEDGYERIIVARHNEEIRDVEKKRFKQAAKVSVRPGEGFDLMPRDARESMAFAACIRGLAEDVETLTRTALLGRFGDPDCVNLLQCMWYACHNRHRGAAVLGILIELLRGRKAKAITERDQAMAAQKLRERMKATRLEKNKSNNNNSSSSAGGGSGGVTPSVVVSSDENAAPTKRRRRLERKHSDVTPPDDLDRHHQHYLHGAIEKAAEFGFQDCMERILSETDLYSILIAYGFHHFWRKLLLGTLRNGHLHVVHWLRQRYVAAREVYMANSAATTTTTDPAGDMAIAPGLEREVPATDVMDGDALKAAIRAGYVQTTRYVLVEGVKPDHSAVSCAIEHMHPSNAASKLIFQLLIGLDIRLLTDTPYKRAILYARCYGDMEPFKSLLDIHTSPPTQPLLKTLFRYHLQLATGDMHQAIENAPIKPGDALQQQQSEAATSQYTDRVTAHFLDQLHTSVEEAPLPDVNAMPALPDPVPGEGTPSTMSPFMAAASRGTLDALQNVLTALRRNRIVQLGLAGDEALPLTLLPSADAYHHAEMSTGATLDSSLDESEAKDPVRECMRDDMTSVDRFKPDELQAQWKRDAFVLSISPAMIRHRDALNRIVQAVAGSFRNDVGARRYSPTEKLQRWDEPLQKMALLFAEAFVRVSHVASYTPMEQECVWRAWLLRKEWAGDSKRTTSVGMWLQRFIRPQNQALPPPVMRIILGYYHVSDDGACRKRQMEEEGGYLVAVIPAIVRDHILTDVSQLSAAARNDEEEAALPPIPPLDFRMASPSRSFGRYQELPGLAYLREHNRTGK